MNSKAFTPFLVSLIIGSIFSCKQENKKQQNIESTPITSGYNVQVAMKNTPDSTWVFYGNNKNKDSVMVINEKFEFSGVVEEPESIFMHTKDFKQGFVYVWLENQKITVTIENGNLNEAKVIGGKSQNEFATLSSQTKALNKEYMEIIKPLQINAGTEKYLDSLRKRGSEILSEIDIIDKKFIAENPDSYVSSSILNMRRSAFGKKEVTALFNGFTEKIKNSANGKLINTFITIPNKPEVGDQYVDFELPDTHGKPIKLSDIKGKYVLVEFWSSWCGPCRKENPSLVKTYHQFRDKGFEILGVSLDENKDHWIKAIKTDKLPWTQVSDFKANNTFPALVYSIHAIPYNFLMDEQGFIIAENLRGKALGNKLAEVFN